MSTKNEVFVRSSEFGKHFSEIQSLVKNGSIEAEDLNIERFAEKMVAMESGLEWVGAQGKEWDLSDYSDVKTATCYISDSGLYVAHKGCIPGVEKKIGDLRCIVYNEYTQSLDYFSIPQKMIASLSSKTQKNASKRISFTYSRIREEYCPKMEQFRVPNFEDICVLKKSKKRA